MAVAIVVLAGSVITGLLLASVLIRQECPDCLGRQRAIAANPTLEPKPPPLDCPRCGDAGVVTLLNGRLAPAPDPLMAVLAGYSHSEGWRTRKIREPLIRRLQESDLRTSTGRTWDDFGGILGRSRFVREGRNSYLLLRLEPDSWDLSEDAPARVFLFESRGRLVDAVKVTVKGGPSIPKAQFVAPAEADGSCARIRLLTWKGRPYREIEIDHGGKVHVEKSSIADEKLGLKEWTLHLRDGKLRVVDAGRGISIAD